MAGGRRYELLASADEERIGAYAAAEETDHRRGLLLRAKRTRRGNRITQR